jgi:hypothetical protein
MNFINQSKSVIYKFDFSKSQNYQTETNYYINLKINSLQVYYSVDLLLTFLIINDI